MWFYFNTSNVTVQHYRKRLGKYKKKDFNTSNVTVQPNMQEETEGGQMHFNTSNVTVQLSIFIIYVIT